MEDNTKYASLLNYCDALKATIIDRNNENSKLRADVKALREHWTRTPKKGRENSGMKIHVSGKKYKLPGMRIGISSISQTDRKNSFF